MLAKIGTEEFDTLYHRKKGALAVLEQNEKHSFVMITRSSTPQRDDPLGQVLEYRKVSLLTYFPLLVWMLLLDFLRWKLLFPVMRWLTLTVGFFHVEEGTWPGYRAWLKTFTLDATIIEERHQKRCPRCIRKRFYKAETAKILKELDSEPVEYNGISGTVFYT